jgi:predicted LPLAT superfamily acyltransferase
MAVFYFFIRIAGVRSAYVILFLILPYYMFFRPSVIRNSRPYLSRRFPQDSPVKRYFRTWLYIFRFGQTLIDQAAMGILGPERFSVDFPQNDWMVDRSRRESPGYVLMVSHIGAWETAMAFVRRMEKTVYFMMDTAHAGRKNDHFFRMAEDKFRFRFIDPYGYMGGLVEASEVLEKDNIVSLMGDRAENWRSDTVPFFGDEARFPVTGPYLSAIIKKDLFILLTARTGRLSFSTRLINLSEGDTAGKPGKKERIRYYLKRYAEEIEKHLEKFPYSWFNFFDFWKKDQ